jgi:hypothetical protein
MIRLPARLAAGLLAGGALVFATSPASADWPMSRHDAQRTASAKGKGNITAPMPTWRFPLGGALLSTQAIVGDATGDGKPEFFFVRGSATVGKRLDDGTLWHTPSEGFNELVTLADLDGDGRPELIANVGTNQVAVIDTASGMVDWLESASDLGYRSETLVGDVDGDGLPEVLVHDCGCCGVAYNVPGAVYSFNKGSVTSPKMLFSLPYATCGGATSTTLVDADGDGVLDVLLGRGDGFDLLDGKTGQVKAAINYSAGLHSSVCIPAHVTGAGEQAICVYANGTSDDSGHRVFAIGYTATPQPALKILWDQKIGVADGKILLQPGMVADLDGDGAKEVTITAATSSTDWSTFVLDGATGTTLTTIASQKLIGTAPVLAGGASLILTETADGFQGWTFTRKPVPSAKSVGVVPGQTVLEWRDLALGSRSWMKTAMLTLDLTGDGTPDLVTFDNVDGTMRVIDATAGMLPKVVGFGPPPSAGTLLWVGPTTLNGKPALATGWNDGIFRLHQIKNGELVEAAPPGVHYDGCYSTSFWRSLRLTPVVGKLDGQGESVLLADCTGTLHRIDAAKADAKTPPVDAWTVPYTSAPIVVPGLVNGAAGVIALQRQGTAGNTGKEQVVGLTAGGSPIWTSPIDGSAWVDVVSGRLDGDGVPDAMVQWGTAADNQSLVHARLISGATGATILEAKPLPIWQPPGAALHDFDGDGIDDIYHEIGGLYVLSGATGQPISPPAAENAVSAMPIVADLDGDGKAEVVLQAGDARVTVLSSDLTKVEWKSTDDQNTVQYGALAQCPDGAKLVESTFMYHNARLTLTGVSPTNLGKVTTMILAGGQPFPDEVAASAAGAYMGVLTAVNVHENITGLGHPTAVVGSSDGWLYGVDPCSEKLDFTYNFGDAVGAAVFGDTDGDGLDEILVEVADGYLYDLKQKTDMTGGSGGTGGVGGFGGAGGMMGGAGGQGGGYSDWITGRATCFCAMPGERSDGALGALFAMGLVVAAAGRRAARRRNGEA